MFYLFRLILFLLASIGIIFLRIKRRKASTLVILAIFALALLSLTVVFPPENLFGGFDSAETALHYMEPNGKIKAVVEGEDSCVIIFTTQNERHFKERYLPKKGNAYCLPMAITTIPTTIKSDGEFFTLIHIRGTEDYYCSSIVEKEAGRIMITDKNDNSIDERNLAIVYQDEERSFICVYKKGYSNNDYLKINGKEIIDTGNKTNEHKTNY